ncbi:UbiA family prenyltransferase [Natronococcus occultus]|uniref:4-hydroxybenzoate polyprenyltransferase-like prenyltransferase n=1 Tax=Natronococcus occultus SP4 TaxID=694430 RepID=L0K0V7_9EURY|nr:UbiA family prenyltransferase [Natronococcus occultus]AGB38636.1 4-hydroxybenzoate polyprenyltransferase-like prenyltransferase [Natronococcus occultus SP4]
MSTTSATRGDRRLPAWLLAGLRFLVHSNLFISLSAASVVITTSVLAGLPLEPLPFFIVFAAAMFVYTVNRFTDLEEDRENVPRRAAFVERYGYLWLALGVGLYLGAIAVAVVLELPGAGYLVLPAVVAVLYTFGVKRVFLVKNLFVGFAWALIPLGVGVYYEQLLTLEVLFLAGYVGAMITIAAAIFDIKDIEGDREQGIDTLPTAVGPRRTRLAAQAANVLVAAVVIAVIAVDVLDTRFLVLLAFHGYVGCYIPFASRDRGPLFYGGIVDGEHVFLAALVLVLEWTVW